MFENFVIIDYELVVQTPLRIGSGVQIGVVNTINDAYLNENHLLIPGSTLRGLIGSQALKLECVKSPPVCTKGKPCEFLRRCLAYEMICNWEHGFGCYFHFGQAHGKVQRWHSWHVRLNRETKTVVKGVGPFAYEAFVAEGGQLKIKSKVIAEERLIELVKNSILAARGQCLGGRRSWGWGYIRKVSILGVRKPTIEESESEKLELEVKTPVPLYGRGLIDAINIATHDLISAIANKHISASEVSVLELKGLMTISWWNEALKKPYRVMALKPGTRISLLFTTCEEASLVLNAVRMFGLTASGQWYTKCGYGILTNLRTNIKRKKK